VYDRLKNLSQIFYVYLWVFWRQTGWDQLSLPPNSVFFLPLELISARKQLQLWLVGCQFKIFAQINIDIYICQGYCKKSDYCRNFTSASIYHHHSSIILPQLLVVVAWVSSLFDNKVFVHTDDPVNEGLEFLPPLLEVGFHPKNHHPGIQALL